VRLDITGAWISDFDFLAWWKAAAVLLTGCFPLIPLFTEKNDPATNKASLWVWISAFGVIVSAGGGLIAQIKESSETLQRQARDSKQTITLLENTKASLLNIQRALSPLEPPKIFGEFELPCITPAYQQLCASVRAFLKEHSSDLFPTSLWNGWPNFGSSGGLILSVSFYRAEPASTNSDPDWEVQYHIPLLPANGSGCGAKFRSYPDRQIVGITLADGCSPPLIISNKGDLRSVVDLSEATVFVHASAYNKTDGSGPTAPLKPELIALAFSNGRQIRIRDFSPAGSFYKTKLSAIGF
jgi:hypothetical protein